MAKLERKPAERVAIAGVIVQALSGALAYVFYRLSHSASAWVLTWQILIGVLVWVMCVMKLRQRRLAEEESDEWERLEAERAAGGAKGQLFEEDEIQAFSARNRLRIFEKYIEPILSIALSGLMAFVAVVAFWPVKTGAQTRALRFTLTTIDPEHALISFACVVALSFGLLLVGMYARGMGRQKAWRALRPGSSYMMFSTLICAGTALGLGFGAFGILILDRVIAFAAVGLMGIVTAEILLNFVLDFYRPRIEGVEASPAYDSRLLALIAEPGEILHTFASTLDYQFGFKVSQTWFYRFIEQAIAPLILFQIITLYFLTSFVIIGPDQQGIVETFGKYSGIAQPGLCWKLPWPVGNVRRIQANQVHTFVIGHAGKVREGINFLWTDKHYEEEFNVMVATKPKEGELQTPVNLLVAASTVRYRIRPDADENGVPCLEKWHYGFSDPEELLEGVCTREFTKYLAQADFFSLMGKDRFKASEDMRALMQAAADNVESQDAKGRRTTGMGIEILSVGLEGIHPPAEEDVPMWFHKLVEALEKKEVQILKAETYAVIAEKMSLATAAEIMNTAQGDFGGRVALERAKAWRFGVLSDAYRSAEEVFKLRMFMDALAESLTRTRNYVIAAPGLDREHIRLDLQDPTAISIADIGDFKEPTMPEDVMDKNREAAETY